MNDAESPQVISFVFMGITFKGQSAFCFKSWNTERRQTANMAWVSTFGVYHLRHTVLISLQ